MKNKTKKRKYLTSWWDYPSLILPAVLFLGFLDYTIWCYWMY